MKKKRTRRKKRGYRQSLAITLAFCLLIGSCVLYMVTEPNRYEKTELLEMGIPESLAELYIRNKEARKSILEYDAERAAFADDAEIDVSRDLQKKDIPIFLQWDERWAFAQYGDDFMALEGCGPTCLSMVYCGLTGDASMHPLAMAKMAEEGGHYVSGIGSSWTLMQDMARELGLTVNEVLFMPDSIIAELQAGYPIICAVGPGDFTTAGHFIVLTDADKKGRITVHDPNSKKKSRKKWDVEQIMSQTSNLWSFSYE